MINIKLKNCNNISEADINLKKNIVNIRYAMNGTGKSTIAKAIDLIAKNEGMSILKPFDRNIESTGICSEKIDKVLLFNEEFVNTIVFKENEVIENSFDVFIKTPNYEERQRSINIRLKDIHINTDENEDLKIILSVGRNVLSKFTLTSAGKLKQTGLIKSLTNTGSIFKLPDSINKFQPLMDKNYNVEWIGWKNDGSKYDDNHICPFCTTELDSEYETEKSVFNSSYTKSNVKNIKEMISYFDDVKNYMDETKSQSLYNCIKNTEDETQINYWVVKFYNDLKYLVDKITKVIEFNSYKVNREDISKLDQHLRGLTIEISDLDIFNNNKVKEVIDSINGKIEIILRETEELKTEMGQLKGLIGYASSNAVSDINDFLKMSGINYCLEIQHESESVTKTILKYKSDFSETPVTNIKRHLSWGERNAFALVLFMHYALSKNADLIILDDPISSFDSNKKYAIINRLFLNASKKKSFHKKTVLMLTHDFQPVIDFVINHKPNGEHVSAYFLKNTDGIISEIEILESDIKSLPVLLSENSSNQNLNKIHRITSLRKLLEHTKRELQHEIAYNLLSCLLHGKQNPTYLDESPIDNINILLGEALIQKYLPDFSYSVYQNDYFSKNKLIGLFKSEQNAYFKLQVFRVIVGVMNLRHKMIDEPLVKYIDEQFHVENDYIFYLDLNKYDTVPDFVIPKCTDFLIKEKII